MTETTTAKAAPEEGPDGGDGRTNVIQQASGAIDELRGKLDELMVQLDLAHLDVRDEVKARLDTAQNVYLAARSRLDDARHDSGANLGTLRDGLEKVIEDLRNAYQSAEAVVRRSRSK